jgi:hypothetical protein
MISLDHIRGIIEKAIKQISFDTDIEEDKVRKGERPFPNNSYQYMKIGNENISLKDLRYRKDESKEGLDEEELNNGKRLDKLICHILNYFIQQRKIININNKEHPALSGAVNPEMLRDTSLSHTTMFTTTKLLSLTSHNTKFEDYSL